jgi:hypothetical protein
MEKTPQAPDDLRVRSYHQRTNLRRRQKPVPRHLPDDFQIPCRQLELPDFFTPPPEAGKPFCGAWHRFILA